MSRPSVDILIYAQRASLRSIILESYETGKLVTPLGGPSERFYYFCGFIAALELTESLGTDNKIPISGPETIQDLVAMAYSFPEARTKPE